MKKQKAKVRTVDKYEKYAEIGEMYSSKWKKVNLFIPSNFRMLCAILGVMPKDILCDFMRMVSYAPSDRATEKQRKAAKKFFLTCRFGQPAYPEKDINTMFKELKAVRTIYSTTENMDWDDKELFWKNNHMYTEYWFKRWFEKNRRQDDISVLEKY
jgi:hypothetical protein